MRRVISPVVSFLLFFLVILTGDSARVAARGPELGTTQTPRTLRVDYYHTGNSKDQWFSLDRVVLEPLAWPGNPAKGIDDSQLGNYLFEVREKDSGKLVYSRGFNSVFGEWKTTEEARHGNRTFSESLRFPSPAGSVEVSLKERGEDGFHEVWKTVSRSEGPVRGYGASAVAGTAHRVAEDGRSGRQGGFAGAGGWVHGRGAREV